MMESDEEDEGEQEFPAEISKQELVTAVRWADQQRVLSQWVSDSAAPFQDDVHQARGSEDV